MRVINATPAVYGGVDSPENALSAAPGSLYICECGDVWIKAALSTGTDGWLQLREGVPPPPPEADTEAVEEETAEDLVSRNNKDELLALAADEEVDDVDENNTKAEIAEAIVAKRNG